MPRPVSIIKVFLGDVNYLNKISEQSLKKNSSFEEYIGKLDIPSAYSLEVVFDDSSVKIIKDINKNNKKKKLYF